MGTPEQPTPRMCVSCGKSIAMDANVCPYCGHDFRVQAAPAKEKSVMPVIGGVLILIGGVLTLLSGVALIGSAGFLDSLMLVDIEGFDAFENLLTACGAILLIFGLIGVIGGIFGIQRKHFGLAIVGGIFSLLGWFIPALIGLILVAISRKEFE